MTKHDWIKLALGLISLVVAANVLFDVTQFFILRLPEGAFGAMASFMLGGLAAAVAYTLTLGILTKLVFEHVEL